MTAPSMTVTKGILYFLIAAFGPIISVLDSQGDISGRMWIAAIVGGIYQGLIALKAYTSRGPEQ